MNSYLTKEEQLLLAVREEVSKYNKCEFVISYTMQYLVLFWKKSIALKVKVNTIQLAIGVAYKTWYGSTLYVRLANS